MTPDEQLDMWLAGCSVHNPTTDECCPDFSCCVPKLKMPHEKRVAYVKHEADRKAGRLQPPTCSICDKCADLRLGVCFDCATRSARA